MNTREVSAAIKKALEQHFGETCVRIRKHGMRPGLAFNVTIYVPRDKRDEFNDDEERAAARRIAQEVTQEAQLITIQWTRMS